MTGEPVKKSSKNGTIEVLRFFFAICIVGVHLNGVSDLGYFKFGHYGVEFFFIVTGLLMAQSIERHLSDMQGDYAKSAFDMVLKKVKRIYPYVIYVTIVVIAFYALRYREYNPLDAVMDAVNLLPYMFFANMAGMGADTPMYLGIMWYLSAMFLGMLILAPIYIRFNSYAKRILFPLMGIFILGFMNLTVHTITLTTEASWGLPMGMLRAIGEMAIGAVCYSVAMWLRRHYDLTVLGKVVILLAEILCFVLLVIYINGDTFYDSSSTVFFLFAVLVTLVYSDITRNIECGKVASFLGNISLPLYLTHMIIILSFPLWFGGGWFYGRELEAFVIIIAFAVVSYLVVEYLFPRLRPARKLFVKGPE